MNRSNLAKTLTDRLNETQQYLAPLFKLHDVPVFDVHIDKGFSVAKVTDGVGSPLITISLRRPIYTNSHRDLEFWDHVPLDEDVGEIVTKLIYHAANPDLFNTGHNLFIQQLRKHGDRALIGVQNDPDSRLSHAYVDLGRIVSYCGNQIYMGLKGLSNEGSANEQTSRVLELTDRMAQGDYDMFTPVTLVSLQSQGHAQDIGKRLLEARRIQVIPELAHLNFEQARDYILKNTGTDILGVPYSGSPGRISKPSKSVN